MSQLKSAVNKLKTELTGRFIDHRTKPGLAIAVMASVLTLVSPSVLADTEPYFVVQGGDVAVGSLFENSSSVSNCLSTDYQHGVNVFGTWNQDHSSGKYYGGGAQGAAFATDAVWGVATGLDSSLPTTNSAYNYPNPNQPPNYLAFGAHNINYANSSWNNEGYSVNFNAGIFGGNFIIPCQPQQYPNAAAAPGAQSLSAQPTYTVDLSTLAGGNYTYKGTLTINDSGPISYGGTGGKPITIAVNGDVYVTSNITYAPYSVPDIPQVNIYAGGTTPANGAAQGSGNIYVAGSVTEIHGNYTAEGDDTLNCVGMPNNLCNDQAFDPESITWTSSSSYSDGLFADCATEVSANNFTSTANAATCNSQLNIYGSVGADFYYLERAYGDVNSVGPSPFSTNADSAAEVFNYSPELWLPDVTSQTCQSGCTDYSYQSLTALPPTL